VDREAIFSASSTELVEATLIRDVDDPSETGHDGDETEHPDDNFYVMDGNHHDHTNNPDNVATIGLASVESTSVLLAPSLARESTAGMESMVLSELALVEAKPVDAPPQRKAISRKLICAVMALLVVVIVALSVGFAVSAKNKEKKNKKGDSHGHDDNNTTTSTTDGMDTQEETSISSSGSNSSNNVGSPADASSSQQPPLQEGALMPVLQRLLEKGGPLRCGVIPGPGLFHRDEESGQAIGFDASLVRCAFLCFSRVADCLSCSLFSFLYLVTGLIYIYLDFIYLFIYHAFCFPAVCRNCCSSYGRCRVCRVCGRRWRSEHVRVFE